MNTELEQATTIELVKELISRSDSLIIAFDPLANKDDEVKSRVHGHLHKVAGLSKIIEAEINIMIKKSMVPD